MLRSMSISQFREWRAFYDLEPWGEDLADLRAASIVKMIHDVNVRRNQRNRPVSDFVLEYGQGTPVDYKSKPHQDKMKAIGAMIAGAHKRA